MHTHACFVLCVWYINTYALKRIREAMLRER